jgi:mannose-6-phosphate isomerase
MPGIALLKNPVQEYAWGSRTFISQLLGQPSPTNKPQAELWMGTHDRGPSMVCSDGEWLALTDVIRKAPSRVLGKSTAARFSNQLPFLFKVLAASKPLSIQAHPDRTQALEGFETENGQGIALNAPHRKYKDPFHKPELLCALTPFWALKGFRRAKEILSLFERIDFSKPGIEALQNDDHDALRDFFASLLSMTREKQERFISSFIAAAEPHASSDPVFEWALRLHREFPFNVGVLAPVLLNLMHLQPGEAISIAAGELHSYLKGAGIELMANSDNVLRGGLTEKYVDAQELLKIVNFRPSERRILHPKVQGAVEWLYPKGAEEFLLSRISLEHGVLYESQEERSVEIMICVQGDVELTDLGTGDTLRLLRGSSILVPAFVKAYRMTGAGTLYKAAVPPSGIAGPYAS